MRQAGETTCTRAKPALTFALRAHVRRRTRDHSSSLSPATLTPVPPPNPDTPRQTPIPWLPRLAGRFLAFEGPDGSGKTTQFDRFVALCESAGLPVCAVREPGGTHVGERIRDILLDPVHDEMTIRCEMLLYMASRAQLVEEKLRPALHRGEIVLADRFIASTLAYQGAAGGLPDEDILAAARVACREVWPDLTIIFDVDETTAAARRAAKPDRMEGKGAGFHALVRKGYEQVARNDPSRVVVIDAAADADEVSRRLLDTLHERLG